MRKQTRSILIRTAVMLLALAGIFFLSVAAAGEELTLQLDQEECTVTLYAGGTNSFVGWFRIKNYDQLKAAWGGEPYWSVETTSGTPGRMNWSNAGLNTKNIWVDYGNPLQNEDCSCVLSCSWNGQTDSVAVTVHVVEPPNGPLTGNTGIEDEYVLALNEEIPLHLRPLPEGWSIPGETLNIDHWVTRACSEVPAGQNDITYNTNGSPFFSITYGSETGDMMLKGLQNL